MLNITTAIIFFLSLTSWGCSQEQSGNNIAYKSVTKSGMKFQWKVQGDRLRCIVSSPNRGWIAIGFNTTDRLTGTNLIMGYHQGKEGRISDRYILRPGVHKSIIDLGEKSILLNPKVETTGDKKKMSFSIPLKPKGKYHTQLNEGNIYYILLAYSQENDLDHHSLMRTSVKIKL